MIPIDTIVSIKSGDEYGGKYTGKLGIIKKFTDDRVGVEFAGLKNHASKYGLFWFKKENVTPSLFNAPKRNDAIISGKEGLGTDEEGDFQMSTIYIGERQSGKTTMLIEMSEKTGATIVVATYPMANYIQLLAAQIGKKIPVPITVTNYIRLLASGGLGKSEKYLVDELQMMLSAMNVEAATVDCDCIEVLRGQQKEGL